MTEQAFDLRRSLRAIRRRWLLVAILTILASGLTLDLALRQPAMYTAHSEVLLPPLGVDRLGKPLRNTTTEIHIARSTDLLTEAGKTLNPPLSATQLRRHLTIKPISTDLLQVRATAESRLQAVLFANAVTAEYVDFANGVAADRTDAAVGLLRQRAADLQQQVRDLEGQINTNVARLAGMDQRSAEGLRQAALIDNLRATSVDASRQILNIDSQIADARLAAELGRNGTRVLEGASRPSHRSSPRPVHDAVGGGVLGLLTGIVLALALEGNDRRLTTRDQIAEAVAAPVMASLPAPRRPGAKQYEAVLREWEPTVIEGLALRQVLGALRKAGEQPVTNIVVVTIAGDAGGAFVACQLAAFAASVGEPTLLLVAAHDGTTDLLRSAYRNVNSDGGGPRPNLEVAHEPDDELIQAAALVITVVVASGPRVLVPRWGRPTAVMMAVSSRVATAERLASVAVGFLDAGFPVQGVVVANPDPHDQSTGRQVLSWPEVNGHKRGGLMVGTTKARLP